MARPTKPKDLKPKADGDAPAEGAGGGGGGGGSKLDLKFIITIVAIILASVGGSAASIYFLAPIALTPQIVSQIKAAGTETGKDGEHGGGGEASGPNQTIGMNLELDEFTVNLKPDPARPGNQFLRTKMSLSIAVPEEEYCDAGGEHKAMLPTVSRTALAQAFPLQGGVLAGAAANLEPVRTPSPGSADEQLMANGGEAEDPFVACQKAFNKNMARYVPTMRDIINQALMKRTAGMLASIEGQESLKDEIKEQTNHLIGDHYSVIRINFSDFIIQY
ncbi:MAG: flagellar basal body-associated FliL family protein [Vampirovibrionales bacterium]|nr:flagellar basal body-associated FliL family protein [Vampirovibrionales bacterium]